MGLKNFKSLFISMPKCIELNAELILGIDLGPHPGPRPNMQFFFVGGGSLMLTLTTKSLPMGKIRIMQITY